MVEIIKLMKMEEVYLGLMRSATPSFSILYQVLTVTREVYTGLISGTLL